MIGLGLLKSYKLHQMLLGGWPKMQILDDHDQNIKKTKKDKVSGSCLYS
jgi:hypothetical protein